MALASKKVVQTSSGDTRPVSPHSVWSDRVWKYNHVAPGQRDSHAQVDWGAIENLRGENLYDHGPAELLEEFRTFVDSWINEPHESALGPGSLSGVEVTLRAMFEWMSDEHIMSVGEIDEETSWSYVDWLHGNYDVVRDDERMGGRPRELTHASAYRAINTLLKLYEQRAPMRRAGVATVPERPFGPDSTALSFVVAEMGLPRVGKLQPIPDEIALPVLTAAVAMIGRPASDVIELQSLVLKGRSGLANVDYSGGQREYRQSLKTHSETILDFQFGSDSHDCVPWREPIEATANRTMIDGREVTLSPIQQLRRLIISVVEACVVVLQGLTGMRAHEIISLEAGKLASDGSPECLISRRTSDGAFEVYLTQGITAKGERRNARWVVGARPVGTDYEPPTVRALRVLAQLLEPWRKLGGRTELLISFRAAKGLPKKASSIGKVMSGPLTFWQKEFAFEHADLSGVGAALHGEHGVHWHIRGHRWRPTFAIHLFRIHPKLVPAISSHLQHTSEVMTQHGYIGNDPSFLDAFNTARVQFTARALLQMSSGLSPAAGSAARLVDKFRDQLRQQIGDGTTENARNRAEEFVVLHGLNIWNAPHGCCLMALMPDKSRCRQMSGTAGWRRITPDLAIRTPMICAGCECLYVRKEHEPYWRAVAKEYTAVLSAADSPERRAELRVSHSRFTVANAMIQRLSGPLPTDSEKPSAN